MTAAPTRPTASEKTVAVGQLAVTAPGGASVFEAVTLDLRAGRVVALFGPSGAGKSTLVRALVEPERLRAQGFHVECAERRRGDVAFVPQFAALLDHLDVRQNIELAGTAVDADRWLDALGLRGVAETGRRVTALSGGQARRVALARALATGRPTLILDEPSSGLDLDAAERLAAVLSEQASERGVAILVVTHDPVFAADVADEFLFMAPFQSGLRSLGEPPADRTERRAWATTRLETMLREADSATQPAAIRRSGFQAASSVRVLGRALWRTVWPYRARDAFRVWFHVIKRSLARPLAFYGVVGALLGFTILYIVARISADVPVRTMLRLVGGTYILALAPPLSAVLFAATSGSAVSAWLGGLELGQQTTALRGAGVAPSDYFWPGSWWGLVVAYAVSTAVLTLAMVAGGAVMFWLYDAPNAWSVLTSDVLDPAPERLPYRARAAWLVAAYGLSIATLVVARSTGERATAAEVTNAMTSVVIRCTLLVVVVELLSVLLLFRVTGQ